MATWQADVIIGCLFALMAKNEGDMGKPGWQLAIGLMSFVWFGAAIYHAVTTS
jgi:hypothetical protein